MKGGKNSIGFHWNMWSVQLRAYKLSGNGFHLIITCSWSPLSSCKNVFWKIVFLEVQWSTNVFTKQRRNVGTVREVMQPDSQYHYFYMLATSLVPSAHHTCQLTMPSSLPWQLSGLMHYSRNVVPKRPKVHFLCEVYHFFPLFLIFREALCYNYLSNHMWGEKPRK